MVQLAWYTLANHASFPKNIIFIHAKKTTKKENKQTELPNFIIEKIDQFPINIINKNLFPKTKKLQSYEVHLKTFLEKEDLFPILIIGERGTGKTRYISEFFNKKFPQANCASFNDDNIAESELFGYKKGAFTGANSNKKGLFDEAGETGLLFLDEIHHLSLRVQAKLMKALQTNSKGEYSFRPLGATEEKQVKFQLICASNKTIFELKKYLLLDFFDRISQRIVELPSLSKFSHKELVTKFYEVYDNMNFKPVKIINKKEQQDIENFLKDVKLEGNYRDLQHIAISVHDYLYDPEIFEDKSLINYLKNQLNLRKQENDLNIENNLEDKDHKYVTKAFQNAFIKSLRSFGFSNKEIEQKLNMSINTRKNWEKFE